MTLQDIKNLLQPTIEGLGYDLWGIEYLSQKHGSLLRIYIDVTRGVTIEDCEIVSQQVSAILDVEDVVPEKFRLEISSPGVPRPLFYPEQFQKYNQHEIQIKLYEPIAGQRKYSGTIIAVDQKGVRLAFNNTEQEFLFSTIAKANLTVE